MFIMVMLGSLCRIVEVGSFVADYHEEKPDLVCRTTLMQ